MRLSEYMNVSTLMQYIADGLVDVRHHGALPLSIYTFSKRVVFENLWDGITTKCRGLIVDGTGQVVSRPFEKFFNIDTDYRPETHLDNLPTTQPIVQEKLDGSLGILYEYRGHSGIATKGSFHSDQAVWATAWYNRHCLNAQWPQGYTPVFEIIAESVQHHVVHYHGVEQLVLLALIKNETGEEADYNTVYHWAKINGVEAVEVYNKTLDLVIAEDRKNAEGYVLSWPHTGQTPLKIKVKHESFLDLQKIVHAATPKAILEALMTGNLNVLDTWVGQTGEPIGMWVKNWVTRFNWKYGEVLVKSSNVFNAARYGGAASRNRKDFAAYVRATAPEYAPVCFAMLDGKDHKPIIWGIVEKAFSEQLSKPFVVDSDRVLV